MKFTLVYDGELPSTGNKNKNQAKWDIRNALDPQLRDLWNSHPALKAVQRDGRFFPKHQGSTIRQSHHMFPEPQEEHWIPSDPESVVDLCAPIEKFGALFKPLVRETFALHCGLKIVFLRKEPPGKIYQGGDIDGRIKTLVDALSMPQHAEQVLHKTVDPIFCLLEDDSMVSGFQVETERLLTDQDHSAHYVRLNIEVDVRVRQAMIYNQPFLGD